MSSKCFMFALSAIAGCLLCACGASAPMASVAFRGEGVGDNVASVGKPSTAAIVCAAKDKSVQNNCVDRWVRAHPKEGLALATELLKIEQGATPSDLVFKAIDLSPGKTPQKTALLAALAESSLEEGKIGRADQALNRLETLARESGNQELQNAIAPFQGDIRKKQGRWGDAAQIFEKLAASNAGSAGDAREAVEAHVKAGQAKKVEGFCDKLVQDGAYPRQALMCLRSAVDQKALTPEKAYPLALKLFAQIPGLGSTDIENLAPSGLGLQKQVQACRQGQRISTEQVLGERANVAAGPNIGLEASVYSNLASNEPDNMIRYCYQAKAAHACLQALDAEPSQPGCSDLRSIGRYIQMTAYIDPKNAPAFIEKIVTSIIELKNNLYPHLKKLNANTRDTRRALFEIHMSLAYALFENKGIAQPTGLRSLKWHVQHAVDRWTELNPGQAFPKEIFDEGMLDDELLKYIERKSQTPTPP